MRKIAARLAGLGAVAAAFAGMLTATAAPVAAQPGNPSGHLSGHSVGSPRLAGCAGSTVRPRTYNPICDDGSGTVIRLHWSSWGGTARGHGEFYTHLCVPNCGQGKVTLYPVDLTARRVQGGKYTRLEYFFPHRVPAGLHRDWVISYYSGSWHGRIV